jgi:DNA-binding IscR family transcriptional regulator
MEPVGRVNRWTGCFLGQVRCSDDVPCSVHARWSVTREAYFHFLKSTTVADLVTQVIPNSYPLEP